MTATAERPVASGGAGPDEPRRRRGVWIVLAVATALTVLGPAGLYVFGRTILHTSSSVTPYRHAIRELRLDMGDAEVSVGPGPEGEARVRKRLTWDLRKPKFTESLVDDVLFVTFRCDGSTLAAGPECGADVDVRVPPGVRVSAVSGSGRIAVRGLSGDLDLRTGSGEVAVAGVRGRLRLRARSGEVAGTGLASSKVRAEADSGQVDLRFATPPDEVDASVRSGDAKIIVPAGSRYRIAGRLGSGTAHLNPAVVDAGSPGLISVRSDSGSTYVDYRDG